MKLIIYLFTIDQLISLRAWAYFLFQNISIFSVGGRYLELVIGNDFGSAFWLPRNLFRGINHNNYQMKLRFKIKCVYIGRFQKKLHHCVQNLIPFPNKLLLDPFGKNWRNIFLYLLKNLASQFVCWLCTGLSCSVSELYVSHNWTYCVQGPPSE